MTSRVPYKQIRARRPTPDTIIVYQAYNAKIASAAVEHQRLNASDAFSMTRMTWIKPSFYWCMYRAGWSFKDKNQSHILQITMKFEGFLTLLKSAVPTSGPGMNVNGSKAVRVQWDPERSIRLGRLDYRSLQLGISGDLNKQWIEEWICDIKDITEDVRRWKGYLDEGAESSEKRAEMEAKVQEELDGEYKEEVIEVDDEIRARLGMDRVGH